MSRPIYLDSHATTPVDPRVLDEMLPYFGQEFGNASSTDHLYGAGAAEAVEKARESLARAIGARSATEIVFTSGATESNNTAIAGMVREGGRGGGGGGGGGGGERPHMITCTTEHRAVLDAADHLERSGAADVTRVRVDGHGLVDPPAIEAAITARTALISVMVANNEVGTIHDVAEIGRIARDHRIPYHTDAAQAAGHMPLDVERTGIGLASLSAHKMYGPKGVGAMYVRGLRPRIGVPPLLRGGGQERGMRSGTLNVPGIVGFGAAARIAASCMDAEGRRHRGQASRMLGALAAAGALLNGHPKRRLARNLSVCFPGIESRAVINSVSDELAVSAGSACTTRSVEPSHVLLAMGLGEDRAHSSIRIGLGRFNTDEEVGRSADIMADAVRSLGRLAAGGGSRAS